MSERNVLARMGIQDEVCYQKVGAAGARARRWRCCPPAGVVESARGAIFLSQSLPTGTAKPDARAAYAAQPAGQASGRRPACTTLQSLGGQADRHAVAEHARSSALSQASGIVLLASCCWTPRRAGRRAAQQHSHVCSPAWLRPVALFTSSGGRVPEEGLPSHGVCAQVGGAAELAIPVRQRR